MKKTARLLLALGLLCSWMPATHSTQAADTAALLANGKNLADQTAATQKITQTLNLNTASASQLTSLPGIGQKTADAIIEKRAELGGKFNSIQQLLDVKGIGTKKLQQIIPFLTL
jgi:competence ComEA-like helix-hairpin-helix protein